MTHYLLSIYQPDDVAPPPEVLDRAMEQLTELNQEIKAAGAWVFSGALYAPSTATVLRLRDGDVLLTDGPFTEGKEHVGGFWIISAPDLDAALAWGRKIAEVITLPIEVRPFQDQAAE